MYSSRAFPYRLVDPSALEDSEVLFPLVDALNHKPNTKITWSRSGDSDTGSMSFVSGQEYQRGAEIYNNYGPKVKEKEKGKESLTILFLSTFSPMKNVSIFRYPIYEKEKLKINYSINWIRILFRGI